MRGRAGGGCSRFLPEGGGGSLEEGSEREAIEGAREREEPLRESGT